VNCWLCDKPATTVSDIFGSLCDECAGEPIVFGPDDTREHRTEIKVR